MREYYESIKNMVYNPLLTKEVVFELSLLCSKKMRRRKLQNLFNQNQHLPKYEDVDCASKVMRDRWIEEVLDEF